jgi:hypothetical protein
MLKKTLLTLSASVLLGTAVIIPNAALAQLPGPPPGPPPASLVLLPAQGPAVLLRVSAPAVLRPDLLLAFRPVAPQVHLRATSPVVSLVSMVLPDCVVSIAAVRPIFAGSRVAPRPTAPTATPAIVTLAMATGTGLMRRRLQLTPMAGPTPPPTTAATTCLRTGDTAPDAFWSVMETD